MSGMTDERLKKIGNYDEYVTHPTHIWDALQQCRKEIDRLNSLRDQVTELIRQLKAEKKENRKARELVKELTAHLLAVEFWILERPKSPIISSAFLDEDERKGGGDA